MRVGAAHPIAAESAVMTPSAPIAPAKTCGRRGGSTTIGGVGTDGENATHRGRETTSDDVKKCAP
eukprot:31083-Pelagococcus_subviridis.AAC.8